jgi:hypothetical protein
VQEYGIIVMLDVFGLVFFGINHMVHASGEKISRHLAPAGITNLSMVETVHTTG